MTINLFTVMVVDILSKYVVDKGATLVKESGQAAAQAASQLCEFALMQLKADPAEARNAERFEANPKGYRVPITDAITDKARFDSDFAAHLSALLQEYKKANGTARRVCVDTADKGKSAITIDNTQNRYVSDRFEP
jgi:hypothetical protein